MNNTQIATTNSAVVPFSDLVGMANALTESKLFGISDPKHMIALMLVAQAEGRHPATVAVDYDFIQGKPAKKPVAMLRDFIAAGGKVEWHELTDKVAEATFSHPSGGVARVRWDMEKAKQAQLAGKDSWKKYPGAMLRSRCVSEGMRAVFPGATDGLYTPAEVADFDDKPKPQSVVHTIMENEQAQPDETTMRRWADQAEVFRQALEADKEESDIAIMIDQLASQLTTEDQLGVWTMLSPKERRAIKEYRRMATGHRTTGALV